MPGESWNDYCNRLDREEAEEMYDIGDEVDRSYEDVKNNY